MPLPSAVAKTRTQPRRENGTCLPNEEIIDAAETSVDPVILSIDVGPARYKRILQKLIAEEQVG